MAKRAEITWATQNGRISAYDRITHVGGTMAEPWSLSVKQAIKLIDAGTWRFFVKRGDDEVLVEARTSRSGCRYLKTIEERDEPHLLLSLPDCDTVVSDA
ncbi:MAG: DUF3892 domain-containing protein [Alphaproteobacteria bacterium]|nr:DUF3892 domain-containing protein [Alphaproteobacteria bacterium]